MDFKGVNSLAHLVKLHGEDELEALLTRAAQDPQFETDAVVRLLDAHVYVFAPDETVDGPFHAQSGHGIPALSWDRGNGTFVLPLFTSLRAMSLSFQGTARYVHIAARTVFEAADTNMDLLLNFGSPHAREFKASVCHDILRAHPPHATQNLRAK